MTHVTNITGIADITGLKKRVKAAKFPKGFPKDGLIYFWDPRLQDDSFLEETEQITLDRDADFLGDPTFIVSPPVVDLDGTDDRLQTPTVPSGEGFGLGEKFTLYGVFMGRQANVQKVLFRRELGREFIRYGNSAFPNGKMVFGIPIGGGVHGTQDFFASPNVLHSVGMGLGQLGGDFVVWRDGVEKNRQTRQGTPLSHAPGRIEFGHSAGAATLNGQIGIWLWWDRLLSNEEIENVHKFLREIYSGELEFVDNFDRTDKSLNGNNGWIESALLVAPGSPGGVTGSEWTISSNEAHFSQSGPTTAEAPGPEKNMLIRRDALVGRGHFVQAEFKNEFAVRGQGLVSRFNFDQASADSGTPIPQVQSYYDAQVHRDAGTVTLFKKNSPAAVFQILASKIGPRPPAPLTLKMTIEDLNATQTKIEVFLNGVLELSFIDGLDTPVNGPLGPPLQDVTFDGAGIRTQGIDPTTSGPTVFDNFILGPI